MIGPTGTVRISKTVLDRVAPFCPHGQVARAVHDELEAWIAEHYELALDELRHLPQQPNPRRGRSREVATIRLSWWQVRRLGIIAEARDLWVGEVVDDWLLAWAARQERIAPPAEPPAASSGLAVVG